MASDGILPPLVVGSALGLERPPHAAIVMTSSNAENHMVLEVTDVATRGEGTI